MNRLLRSVLPARALRGAVVLAVATGGAVALAVPASAAPTPVTVTVIGAQNYGGTSAFAGSTGVSGLTVSSITCTGLTNASTISPTTHVGGYTIDGTTCSGGVLSNPSYAIAGYRGSTYTVYRAPLNVSAANKTKTYASANPALTYSITGFVNGEDASVVTGVAAISTTATTTSNVGSYPITVAQGTLNAANYYFTFTAGTLTVNPYPVTVTVIGAQNYGGAAAFAGSTGISGLTVSGIACTALTNTSTIAPTLGIGGYTIDGTTCSGGTLSSTNFTIAGYTGSTYTVYRAALTVAADNKSKTYGTANPTLTYTITGFQNGDDASVLSGAPALSTTATTTSNVGSYAINVSAGSLKAANYYFVFAPGTLTVNPAPVTINVIGAQNYGGASAFSGTTGVSGLTVTGVTCTNLSGGTTIAPTVGVGTYTVDGSTCGGGVLSSSNYSIAGYTGANYYVFRAPLTVTADDKSRAFGVANPALTYTISGFVNGEDASVVGGAPALSTTATSTSDVGSYPISAAQGTLHAANYYFVFQAGTLTVSQAQVTISVFGAQNYGGASAFAGSTGVSGLTVTGVTCAGLTGGTSIAPTVAAGTYTIDGSTCSGGVLSSTNYTIAGYTGTNYYVFKAPLTVTADDKSRVYDAANPAFTYQLSGFVNGDDASAVTGAPAITTSATSTSNVGTYAITPALGSLKAANYYFVFANGTLTVNPAPVVVSVFGAQNYGGASAFAGSTKVSGLTVTGTTCTGLTGGTAIAPTVPAGTYSIDSSTCGGGVLSSSNYTISSYNGTAYYVYRAPLTITAVNQSRTYGADNLALTYTMSGFVNGENALVLSGAPALSTTATSSSGVGTYPITVSAGSLKPVNYYYVFASGTLTVTPAVLTVTANDATRAYGSPDPAFTASYSGFVNGDTAAVLTGSPALSSTDTSTSDPGSYPISVSAGTLAASNYTFAFVPGTLTITKAVTSISTTSVLLGNPSATITWGASATPIAGATITFTIGTTGTVVCTSVTDSTGKATCTPTLAQHLQIVTNGYTATYAGSTDFTSASKLEK